MGAAGGRSPGPRFTPLAALLVGRYQPQGAFGAALVFGFAGEVATSLTILDVGVPSTVLLMVPYIVTIVVVAGFVGRSAAVPVTVVDATDRGIRIALFGAEWEIPARPDGGVPVGAAVPEVACAGMVVAARPIRHIIAASPHRSSSLPHRWSTVPISPFSTRSRSSGGRPRSARRW